MGLILDGIGTSEAIDSSGELLELKGLDISDLTEGRGVLNTEHRGDDAPGYSYLDIIGRVIYAKKLYSREDCENDRQRMYWDEVKLPYLYIKCELFDSDEDGDHAAAKAVAAMVRHYNRRGLPILVRYSIEGSTLQMDNKTIKAAIARRVASTIKPANKTCKSGILEDDWDTARGKKEGTFLGGSGGVLDDEMTKFERPDAMKLGRSYTVACDPEVDEVAETFREAVKKFAGLAKTIAAGSYNAAPSTLTGGAALQREDLGEAAEKRRIVAVCKAAIRDHDPETHGPFKTYLKSLLPEASEEFLDRFDALSDELGVRTNLKLKYLQKDEAKVRVQPSRAERTRVSGKTGKVLSGTSVGGRTRTPEEVDAAYHETLDRIRTANQSDPDTAFDFGENAGKPPPAVPPVEQFRKMKPRTDLPYGKGEIDPKRGVVYIGGREADNRPHQVWRLYAPEKPGSPKFGPHDQSYMELLMDPKVNEAHDHAMDNWVTVHRLARQGALPSRLVAATSIYALMAPNESGPIQDLAHALFEDLMAKGFDPTKKNDPDEMSDWAREYADMAVGQHIPEYMHDYFLSEASGIWRDTLTADEARTGNTRLGLHTVRPMTEDEKSGKAKLRSAVGKLSLEGKGTGKWNTVEHYHNTHGFLEQLVRQHGVDADKIMGELLERKWAEGKIPQDQRFGFGFGLKTFRYTLGMLGLGRHVVPDTHFIRHTFGLHPDDGNRVDAAKSIFGLEAPHREKMLQGLDSWFRMHHPAFEWTRQKMQKRYGEDFGDQATFPAFWLHWTLIGAHDKARGWPDSSENGFTTHEVLWNSARNILRSAGLPSDPHDPRLRKAEEEKKSGLSLEGRCATAMLMMRNRFGPMGAQWLYLNHIIPLVLNVDKPEALYKAELLERLMKGEFAEDRPVQRVMHKGAVVEPGEVEYIAGPQAGKRIPLVAIGKDYHHVLSMEGDLMKLKADHPSIRIVRPPKLARTPTTVDSRKHGHPTLHGTDAQHDIIHGVDMARRVSAGTKGYAATEDTHGTVGWYQSAEGHMVYVKPESLAHGGLDEFAFQKNFTPTMRDTAYSRLAHEFFGLGEHVPVTTTFQHPVTGEWHSAQHRVEGEHYSPKSHKHRERLGQMARTGVLDKLALMDMILGHGDRHIENGILGQRVLHLIDNGLSFAPKEFGSHYIPAVNEFWSIANRHNDGNEWYTQPLHPSAAQWVSSLDPQAFAKKLDILGVPKSERAEVVRRLQAVQQRARKPVSRGAAFFAPFLKRGAPDRDMLEQAGFFEEGESATRPTEE